jgi:hypothetical protein
LLGSGASLDCTMRLTLMVGLLALFAACTVHAATPPPTALAIAFYPQGMSQPEVQHYTLRCGPPGGTVPSPAVACRTLAGLAHPFAPTPPNTICTALAMGPEEATVRGRVRGVRVSAHLSVQGGCEINRWHRVAAIVPGYPNR